MPCECLHFGHGTVASLSCSVQADLLHELATLVLPSVVGCPSELSLSFSRHVGAVLIQSEAPGHDLDPDTRKYIEATAVWRIVLICLPCMH